MGSGRFLKVSFHLTPVAQITLLSMGAELAELAERKVTSFDYHISHFIGTSFHLTKREPCDYLL
jgi:hypothetical protein